MSSLYEAICKATEAGLRVSFSGDAEHAFVRVGGLSARTGNLIVMDHAFARNIIERSIIGASTIVTDRLAEMASTVLEEVAGDQAKATGATP